MPIVSYKDFSAGGNVVPVGPTPTAPTTPQQEPGKPGFLSRVATDFKQAGQTVIDSAQHGATALQQNDGSLGGEFKTAGKLVETGLRDAGAVAGAAFSPIIQLPLVHQAISELAAHVSSIPGIKEIAQHAVELSAQHPELAKDIGAIANIALLGTPSTGAASKIPEKIAATIRTSADEAVPKNLDGFVRKLLTPEQTKAVKEDQVGRTSETGKGIFKRSVVAPTPSQIRAEEAVKQIPGIRPEATVQQNYNVIKEANTQAAQKLESDIVANNFIVPKKETMSRLDTAAEELTKSPLIVGDAEKTAERLVNGARQFVDNNPGTGKGILDARKQYDQWVLSQKPKAFDATAENAFTTANRQVRKAFNDILDEKATNVDVRQSLSHQSALYDAMETLTPKAAIEADTAIGRTLQRVGNVLGTKSKIVQGVAAAVGIGGLGAAATFAPIVAGVGVPLFLTYKAGQIVMKPAVRKSIANLLEKAGSQLDKTDRAFLEGVLQQYGDDSSAQ